jgi:UDP-N-acetylglucosamine transferase subunit ALG13
MIFLSVGTQFAFDRLVKGVDDALQNGVLDEEVYAQIGEGSYKPRNFEYVEFLEKEKFDGYVKKASSVISHCGVGILALALDSNKPLLVMPRLKKYSEVVNDHQVVIAVKFQELGHILTAYSAEELPDKIKQLNTFIPKSRTNQSQMLSQRISKFLSETNFSGN